MSVLTVFQATFLEPPVTQARHIWVRCPLRHTETTSDLQNHRFGRADPVPLR